MISLWQFFSFFSLNVFSTSHLIIDHDWTHNGLIEIMNILNNMYLAFQITKDKQL